MSRHITEEELRQQLGISNAPLRMPVPLVRRHVADTRLTRSISQWHARHVVQPHALLRCASTHTSQPHQGGKLLISQHAAIV